MPEMLYLRYFFVQKTSEEHLASLKFPSRQNPQIQETNFGNLVSCIRNSKVLQLRKLKKKK